MIRVDNLAAEYGKKTVFSRLSFSLGPEKSPLVLAGRNGSGKSTLLRILGGFRKPGSGSVSIGNRKSGIAWLPQHYRVSLEIPVLDFVAMACEIPGSFFSKRISDANKKSREALRLLGLEHLENQNCGTLSGGEWQLACLAQMLVQDADIWLLDEPTASLDIGYKKKVFRILWDQAASGKTIIVSTHDLPFIPEAGGSFLLISENPRSFDNQKEERSVLMKALEKI